MSFLEVGNIRRFRLLLEREVDADKRATLRKLLAEEKAKLADQRECTTDQGDGSAR